MDTDTQTVNTRSLVSILMLTYNRAQYIDEAISSVLKQTYPHWELIIIDDGSTDETEQVIKSYTDRRIKYIQHPKNNGLFVRRAESLTYASGAYVAILDSDDIWHDPSKLAVQVDFLDSNPQHVLVGTYTKLIDAQGKTIGSKIFALYDKAIRARILIQNQFTHSAVLIRKDALGRTKGYQPTLAEDLELFLQLGKIGKLANLPLFATSHRIHVNSMNDHGGKMAAAIHNIIQQYKNSYPHFYQAYTKNLLRQLYAKLFR